MLCEGVLSALISKEYKEVKTIIFAVYHWLNHHEEALVVFGGQS